MFKELSVERRQASFGEAAELVSLCCHPCQQFQQGFLRRGCRQFSRVGDQLHGTDLLEEEGVSGLATLQLTANRFSQQISLDVLEGLKWTAQSKAEVSELVERLLEMAKRDSYFRIDDHQAYLQALKRIAEFVAANDDEHEFWSCFSCDEDSELSNIRMCKASFTVLAEYPSIPPSKIFIQLINELKYDAAALITSDSRQLSNLVYHLL